MEQETHEQKMGFPLGTFFAFAIGTATGLFAGLMTEKKNRDKAAHMARDLKGKAVAQYNMQKEKTAKPQVVASDIRREAQKIREEAEQKINELRDKANI